MESKIYEDICEIRELKLKLQREVTDAIFNKIQIFNNKTGICVIGLTGNFLDCPSIGDLSSNVVLENIDVHLEQI